MKKKVAIIDHLGAHGSSHHFYLFGQAQGLIQNNVLVNLYTNATTINPEIKGLDFYQFYKRIFNTNKIIAFFRYFIGSLKSHLHAKISKCKIFHYHLFGSSVLVVFNMILAKIFFAKIERKVPRSSRLTIEERVKEGVLQEYRHGPLRGGERRRMV